MYFSVKHFLKSDKSLCAQRFYCQVVFHLLFYFFFSETMHACGLIWPNAHSKCHFSNIDDQGNVLIIQRLGKLTSLEGKQMPFYAIFKSDVETSSPIAGYGWSVPLLESRIVQMDERRFCMFQPDGFKRIFGSRKENPNLLSSRDTWKAEIRGSVITARCRCENMGNILVFKQGRLVSMETQGEKYEFIYDGAMAVEIRQGYRTILKVIKNPITGDVTGLNLLNEEKIELERDKRPRIQVVDGQQKISVTDESLSKIIMPDGTIRTFSYGLDQDDNPYIKTDSEEIAWSAATHLIIRDGEWKYGITPGPEPGANAAIARTNMLDQTEFWHRNIYKGEEITEGIDGVKRIKTWFTSGKFKGYTRKETQIKDGIKRILCEYSYDENRRLMRIRREKTDTFFVYEPDGNLAAVVVNGEVVRSYTTNGYFLAEKYVTK